MTISRHFLIFASPAALVFFATCSFALTCIGQDTTDISMVHQKGQQYRVESQYQHTGTVVIVHPGQDKEPQNLSIDVKARLDFQERLIGSAFSPQSVRLYDQSIAKFNVEDGNAISKLSDDNRLIVTRVKTDSVNEFQIASVQDMLEQHELDLLKNPADPLTYVGLLNQKKTKVGEEWVPNRDSLARFLAVDRVTQSEVKLMLKSVQDDVARIYITGKLSADVDDALTSMTLTGAFEVDLKAGHVNALRLNIAENRQPGQIAPGYEGQTKIDVRVSVAEDIPELSNESLKAIGKSHSVRNLVKWEPEAGSFVLKYLPSWKLIASEGEAAVLRYVDDGDLLVQCNIVRLNSRPEDNPLLLEDFKREVTKIIAVDSVSQISGASESHTTNGLRAMQITVRGVEEEVPLNWIYYNVASPDGRQVTFVFTLEEEIAGRVTPVAKKLVDGFEFYDPTDRDWDWKKKSAVSAAKASLSDAAKR
jgi:hypothetical protein